MYSFLIWTAWVLCFGCITSYANYWALLNSGRSLTPKQEDGAGIAWALSCGALAGIVALIKYT